MPGTQRSAMPANTSTPRIPPADLHDPPTSRAIRTTARQAQRARRAETVRQRQRAALLTLLARTMAELHISMAELNEARRALARVEPSHEPEPDGS